MKTKTLHHRLFAKVNMNGPVGHVGTPCWNWTGARVRNGYGHMREWRDGRWIMGYCHRISFELHVGAIPDGLFVLHRCDNRRCVRPDHLFLGTNKENTLDALRKGRFVFAPGRTHLSEQDVIFIRESNDGVGVISERYRIGRDAVHAIRSGKTWAWVGGPRTPVVARQAVRAG